MVAPVVVIAVVYGLNFGRFAVAFVTCTLGAVEKCPAGKVIVVVPLAEALTATFAVPVASFGVAGVVTHGCHVPLTR